MKEITPTKRALISVFSLTVFFAVWELLWKAGLLNKYFFSSPLRIIESISILTADPSFWDNFSKTFIPMALGFLIAIVFSMAFGILLGSKKTLYIIFHPFIYLLNSVPKIVLIPIFLLWMGIENVSKMILIFMITSIPILINVIQGTRSTDKKYIEMAKSFGASKMTIAKEIYFYTIGPYVLAGAKMATSPAIGITIAAEFFGIGAGLGRMISTYSHRMEPDFVFALAFIIIIVNLILVSIFDYVSPRVFKNR